METDERVKPIEEAIVLMKNLLLRHEERLDHFDESLRKSREDFDFKMNALIDAQIKNEESTIRLEEASRSQLRRIEKLET
jgi:hypothetical protein